MTVIEQEIARLLIRRCTNCFRELPGYNVHGRGWNWARSDVGPFCDECWKILLEHFKKENR